MAREQHVRRAAGCDHYHAGDPDGLVMDASLETDKRAKHAGDEKSKRDVKKFSQQNALSTESAGLTARSTVVSNVSAGRPVPT
jgi:hypothetical protein